MAFFRSASITLLVAALLPACDNPARSAAYCDRLDSYNRHCFAGTIPDCELTDEHNQCLAAARWIRPEAVAAFDACDSAGACGDLFTPGSCSTAEVTAGIATSGWHSFAHALCAQCPSVIGDATATPDTCYAALTSPPPLDGGQFGFALLLTMAVFSDTALAPLEGCIQSITATGNAACMAFAQCERSHPIVVGDAGASACTAAGPDP